MSAPAKHLRIKYPTADRFLQDFFLIREGRIFLPGAVLGPGAPVEVDIHVPGLKDCYVISGRVTMALDAAAAKSQNRPAGIWVDFSVGSAKVLAQLELALRAHDGYRQKLGLPPAPPRPAAAAPIHPPAPDPPTPTPQRSPKAKPGVTQPPPAKPLVSPAAPEAKSPGPLARDPENIAETFPDRTRLRPDPNEEAVPLGAEEDGEDLAGQEPEEDLDAAAGEETAAAAAVSEAAAGSALELERLREMLDAGEAGAHEEPETPAPVPPPVEKKDLTAEERTRLAPVGEFIMDLVKAMLRSGYYDPDHPQSRTAKTGLYDQLREVLAEANEIMIVHQDTREKSDVLISGIIEDQVSVRAVIGAGMAELFIPRLKDYFERKGLVSFAIKSDITRGHFEGFVDVMSDPRADRGVSDRVGALLTEALVDRGITEISAVFLDDALILEEKLPWRVQMAVNRLAKDIKVLPMFKGLPAEEIRRMKARIVEDIIRPLRHPHMLRDIVLNCYVIARHVEDLDEEDLEQTVIDSFPLAMLLATSRFILEELERIKEQKQLHPDNPAVLRRHQGVSRVLKWVSHRVISEDAPGAREFLMQMYFNRIIPFHELPPVVQYHINTIRLSDDIKQDLETYVKETLAARTASDAQVLLDCIKRAAPLMIERGDWSALAVLARALARAGEENRIFREGPESLRGPLDQVFGGLFDLLVEAYQRADKGDQPLVEEIAALLGPFGIELLVQVLAVSESRATRKSAVDALAKQGDRAAAKVRELLDDSSRFWYLHRNALLVLGLTGHKDQDMARTRKFLRHPHPRLREEALNAAARLAGRDAETHLIAALDDPDLRVARRALSGLVQLQPLSPAGTESILSRIRAAPAEDKSAAAGREERLALIIRAAGAMPELTGREDVEAALAEAAAHRWKKKGWLTRIRRTLEDEDESPALPAIIEAMGKLGGAKAAAFLENAAREDSPLGRKAKEALDRIQIRTA